MKKLMFIGLAFFALSLMSCKGELEKELGDDQADCEQKAETHVWNEAEGKCEAKTTTAKNQEECAKDFTKKWDASAQEGKGECRDATKEECTLAEVMWDEANNKCVLKQEEKGTYTVTRRFLPASGLPANNIKLEIPSKNMSASLLRANDCIRLKESDFALLKISTYNTATLVKALCDSTDVSVAPPGASGSLVEDCKPGHYSVIVKNGANFELRLESSANANIDQCKELAGASAGT